MTLIETLVEIKDFIALQGRNGVSSLAVQEKFKLSQAVLDYVVKYLLNNGRFIVNVSGSMSGTSSSSSSSSQRSAVHFTACESERFRALGIMSSQDIPHESALVCLELIAAAGPRGMVSSELTAHFKGKCLPVDKLITCGLIVKNMLATDTTLPQARQKNARVKSRQVLYQLKRFSNKYDFKDDFVVYETFEDDFQVIVDAMDDILRFYRRSCMLLRDMARCLGITVGTLLFVEKRFNSARDRLGGVQSRLKFFESNTLGYPAIFSNPGDEESREVLEPCIGFQDGLPDDDLDEYSVKPIEEEEEEGCCFPIGAGCFRNLSGAVEQANLLMRASGTKGVTTASLRDLMGISSKCSAWIFGKLISELHTPTAKVQEGKVAVYRVFSESNYERKLREVEAQANCMEVSAEAKSGSISSNNAAADGDGGRAEVKTTKKSDVTNVELVHSAESVSIAIPVSAANTPIAMLTEQGTVAPIISGGIAPSLMSLNVEPIFISSSVGNVSNNYKLTTPFRASVSNKEGPVVNALRVTVKQDPNSGYKFYVITDGSSGTTSLPVSGGFSRYREFCKDICSVSQTENKSTSIDSVISAYAANPLHNVSVQHVQIVRHLLTLLAQRGNVLEYDDFIYILRAEKMEKEAKTLYRRSYALLIDRLITRGLIIKMVFDLKSAGPVATANGLDADIYADSDSDSDADDKEATTKIPNDLWLHQLRLLVRNEDYVTTVTGSSSSSSGESSVTWTPEQVGRAYSYNYHAERIKWKVHLPGEKKTSLAKRQRIILQEEAVAAKKRRLADEAAAKKRIPTTPRVPTAVLRGVERCSTDGVRFKSQRSRDGSNITEYFYPASFVDHTIDTCGIVSVDASTSTGIGDPDTEGNYHDVRCNSLAAKSFAKFLSGLASPNIVISSKELFKYLVCWSSYTDAIQSRKEEPLTSRASGRCPRDRIVSLTVRNQSTVDADAEMDMETDDVADYLSPLSLYDILKIPGSFRFIVKYAGLYEELAGQLGARGSRFKYVDLMEDDIFVMEAVVGRYGFDKDNAVNNATSNAVSSSSISSDIEYSESSDLPSFNDVMLHLQARNQADTVQKMRCHAISWLMLQFSFLRSLGMCLLQTPTEGEPHDVPDSSVDIDDTAESAMALLRVLSGKYACVSMGDDNGENDEENEDSAAVETSTVRARSDDTTTGANAVSSSINVSPSPSNVSIQIVVKQSVDTSHYSDLNAIQLAVNQLYADVMLHDGSIRSVETVLMERTISMLDLKAFGQGALLKNVANITDEDFHVVLCDGRRRLIAAVDQYWSEYVIEGLAPLFGFKAPGEWLQGAELLDSSMTKNVDVDSEFGYAVWTECLHTNRHQWKAASANEVEVGGSDGVCYINMTADLSREDEATRLGECVLAVMIRNCYDGKKSVHPHNSIKLRQNRVARYRNIAKKKEAEIQKEYRLRKLELARAATIARTTARASASANAAAAATAAKNAAAAAAINESKFYFWDSGSDDGDGESVEEGTRASTDSEAIATTPATSSVASSPLLLNIDSMWSPLHDALLLKEFLRSLLILRHHRLLRRLISSVLQDSGVETSVPGTKDMSTTNKVMDANILMSLLCDYGCTFPLLSWRNSDSIINTLLNQPLASYLMTFGATVYSVANNISRQAVKRVITGAGLRLEANLCGSVSVSLGRDSSSKLVCKKVRNRLYLLLRDCSCVAHLLCLLLAKEKEGYSAASVGNGAGTIGVGASCSMLVQPGSKVAAVLGQVMQLSCQQTAHSQYPSTPRHVSPRHSQTFRKELTSKLIQIHMAVSELRFILQHIPEMDSDNSAVSALDMSAGHGYYGVSSRERVEAEIQKRLALIPKLTAGGSPARAADIAAAEIELCNQRFVCSSNDFLDKFGYNYVASMHIWEIVRSPVSLEIEWLLYRQLLGSEGVDCVTARNCRSLMRGLLGDADVSDLISVSKTGLLSSLLQLTGSLLHHNSTVRVSNSLVNVGFGTTGVTSDDQKQSVIQLDCDRVNIAKLFPTTAGTAGAMSTSLQMDTTNQLHAGLYGVALNQMRSQIECSGATPTFDLSAGVETTAATVAPQYPTVCTIDSSRVSDSELMCPWVDSLSKQRILSLYYALISRVLAVIIAQVECTSEKILESMHALLDLEQMEILLNCMVRDGLLLVKLQSGSIGSSASLDVFGLDLTLQSRLQIAGRRTSFKPIEESSQNIYCIRSL